MKSTLLKIGIAFSLSLFFTWVHSFTPQTFYSLDNKLRDYMFLLRGELPKSGNVVIIDVDNKSLEKVGQWPWSRDITAQLIDTLTKADAGIIGLDMVFAETDRTSPHLLKEKFPSITQELPNNDKILGNVFSYAPVVGGYIFDAEESNLQGPLIPAVFVQKGLKDTTYLREQQGIILNTPQLQESLYSSGFFNTNPDDDGLIRSTPLIQRYKGDIYPSLAFEMLRIYSGVNRVDIIGDIDGVRHISFGDFKVPTDHSGSLLINFRGAQKHFQYISASDILNGTFKQEDIAGKFILVGTSALGLLDMRATPFDSVFPGVEVHANIIDNVLQQDFINKPLEAWGYDLVIIWVLTFALMLIFSYIDSIFLIPVAVLLFGTMLYAFYTLLFSYGLVLTLITPILVFITTLIASLTVDYIITSKHKEQAKRILGKKVSKSVMDHLLAHSEEDLVAPKEVEATVFFSDIRSFTSISEKIGSPTQLITLLNSYMTPMVDTIVNHQGTIDKFIGDAIMAYWNAPIKVEEHADKALQAAIKQIELLQNINKELTAKYGVNIDIGIGMHTGIVTAGDMGSEGRSDYTVIGDNVNIASRIEGLTKVYHAHILISKATYDTLKHTYNIRPVDIVALKGKERSTEIFEVLTVDKTLSDKERETYKRAITAYRDAQLSEALTLFNMLTKVYDDPLYALYEQRCQYYLDNKTEIFSPISVMSHK